MPAQASHVVISIPGDATRQCEVHQPASASNQEAARLADAPSQHQPVQQVLHRQAVQDSRMQPMMDRRNMVYISVTPAGGIKIFSDNVNLDVQHEV